MNMSDHIQILHLQRQKCFWQEYSYCLEHLIKTNDKRLKDWSDVETRLTQAVDGLSLTGIGLTTDELLAISFDDDLFSDVERYFDEYYDSGWLPATSDVENDIRQIIQTHTN